MKLCAKKKKQACHENDPVPFCWEFHVPIGGVYEVAASFIESIKDGR